MRQLGGGGGYTAASCGTQETRASSSQALLRSQEDHTSPASSSHPCKSRMLCVGAIHMNAPSSVHAMTLCEIHYQNLRRKGHLWGGQSRGPSRGELQFRAALPNYLHCYKKAASHLSKFQRRPCSSYLLPSFSGHCHK